MPTPPTPDPVLTPEEFQAAQTAEWDEYVAVNVITVDGVRAFNPGDPVPKSHVDSGAVAKTDVARRETKAGKAVTGSES